jgi:hypothetical protein
MKPNQNTRAMPDGTRTRAAEREYPDDSQTKSG